MSDFATPSSPDLTNNLRRRLVALRQREGDYPIRLSVDETEECIRVLWEFVGHMGSDVGTQGYEAHLLARARHWAQEMQTAMLAAIAYIGPNLMDGIEDALTVERLRPPPESESR